MAKKLSMSNKPKKNINETNHTFNAIFAIIIFLSAGCIGVSLAFIIKHFLTKN